ncbi:hypothetical protein E3N88_04082 [Mikania micrantha]|uniref:Uncharacterized protein n=1 Tax=Mikania micrantha TaxID=192012 RepID=A0A5N6PTD9_9ASTR|nr:hypothetical protein E3N88_04082 [Mikania micrantha]
MCMNQIDVNGDDPHSVEECISPYLYGKGDDSHTCEGWVIMTNEGHGDDSHSCEGKRIEVNSGLECPGMIRIESGSENAKIGVADLQWAYHTPRMGVSYAQNLTLRPEVAVNAGIWATGQR